LEPQIFTGAADFYGLSVLIRRAREYLRSLLGAEAMINITWFCH